MFDESTVIPAGPEQPQYEELPSPKRQKAKRMLLIVALVLSVAVFILAVVLIAKRYGGDKNPPVVVEPIEKEREEGINNGGLPTEIIPGVATTTDPFGVNGLDVEYLSFNDFYEIPDNSYEANFQNYELPINIKIDGMNYYDLARKINLDLAITDLNGQGFAVLDNPWPNEVNNFYSFYEKLETNQIPFLITSDFLIYYYQNSLKKVFKDIEEHVFYDNLWVINKEMYEMAKSRYETRLSEIGNINDSVLEGQRMELAFFSVALELLKPAQEQISSKGALDDPTKFSESDADRFYFNPPVYLRDEVIREAQMIRAGKGQVKSPNLLYVRDYTEFSVPKEYKTDAKLNNFYLASRWLNSSFPLYYQDDSCPDCYLDREDWRLNMVAASLIATDFSEREDLKGRWARIYKLMAFFKGLREEIDYVDFRDALVSEFGSDYDVYKLFDDKNPEAMANLEKLKDKLAQYEFAEIRGALNKTDVETRKKIGFKLLTEPYWPNDYIFGTLTHPKVGRYLGSEKFPDNLTVCDIKGSFVRCNGTSLDIANLVTPMSGNELFDRNANYVNYQQQSEFLVNQFNRDGLWQTANYWSTLSLMKSTLSPEKEKMPAFASSDAWRERGLKTAVSSWINLQLPWEQISLAPRVSEYGLSDYSRRNENIYIEPNLPLINGLIATNNMMAKMFTALRLQDDINLAAYSVKAIDADLQLIKRLIEKELAGQEFDDKEDEALIDFARRYVKVDKNDDDKILWLPSLKGRANLKEDLSRLKLMVVVYQSGENKVMAVGPIWDYQESR